jgi:hypothetical protein
MLTSCNGGLSSPIIKIVQPWWNKKLSGLRAKTRKLFNIAKRTGQWDTYKESLTSYNKERSESQTILMEEVLPGVQ